MQEGAESRDGGIVGPIGGLDEPVGLDSSMDSESCRVEEDYSMSLEGVEMDRIWGKWAPYLPLSSQHNGIFCSSTVTEEDELKFGAFF